MEAEHTVMTWCTIDRRSEVVEKLLPLVSRPEADIMEQVKDGIEVGGGGVVTGGAT